MRKALIPMLASLVLCGAATTALVISSARAQPSPHNPLMVTAPGVQLAANDSAPPPPRGMRDRDPAEMATRMKTSRAAVDRLLDVTNPSVTLVTLGKAAKALGRRLSVTLVSV